MPAADPRRPAVPSPVRRRKSRRLLLVLLGVILSGVVGGAGWWLQAGAVARRVAAALPPLPNLDGTPAVLHDRLLAADRRARRRLGALHGLAELSELYHANGFLEEAMRCEAALAQLEPSNPRWLHRRATLLAGYGEIDPALELWKRVVALAPDYIPARLRLGDCELKSNHPAAAASAYQAVLARETGNPYAQLGLARIDFEAGRWDAARDRLEKLVEQTSYTLGYDLIVTLYERTGQPERAAAIRGAARASGAYRDPPDPWIDELIDVCFDPYRLALVAGAADRAGDPVFARRLLERAIGLAPQDISPRFQLGLLAIEQHNAELALEQLTSCTVIDPHFADAWAHLSALQGQLGDAMTAERTLAAGLASCPESPGLHLMRARSLRQAGRNGDAAAEYRASIRFRPNEPEAYVELGSVYIIEGRLDEAMRQMKLALEFDPANPEALSVLALAAIETGNEQEARYWMKRVAEQPRIEQAKRARFAERYLRQFGRAWDEAPGQSPDTRVPTPP